MNDAQGGCGRCDAARAMDTTDAPLMFDQLCVSCQKEIVPSQWGEIK